MAFQFILPNGYRQTSAAVFNAAGTLVRTLWTRRSYAAGSYGEIWDGLDDYGNVATGGPFTIKVVPNNIRYNWLGLIGNTEDSWTGPNNWDGGPSSFVTAIAFLNGKGYTANGYNEDGYYASVVSESDPNAPYPMNPGLFGRSTTPDYMDVTTDGTTLFFLARGGPSYVIAFSTDGRPVSFGQGRSLASLPNPPNQLYNAVTRGTVTTAANVLDVSPYQTAAITAVAVERTGVGNILATAHGQRGTDVASADRIFLWDKGTGAALGSITISNPQKMAFDLKGNLWVISGYGSGDLLYKVTGVGSSNTISTPIRGLSNPMSIAVAPTTGDLFVADGGRRQQILEYNPSTYALVSTLGASGGYGQGSACNANIDPAGRDTPTLWLDPGPNITKIHYIGLFTPFPSWVSVDDKGDLWVADWSAFRILHYRKSGSRWVYVNRIMYEAWNKNDTAMPRKAPGRVFGGPQGLLEFRVDWSKPLKPGDPEAPGGNGMWDVVRNWMPCYAAINPSAPGGIAAEMSEVQVMPNGTVLGLAYPPNNVANLVQLPPSGVLTYENSSRVLHSYTKLDDNGNTFLFSVAKSGTTSVVSYNEFPRTGFDAGGFPVYGPKRTIASYTADHGNGDPQPSNYDVTRGPSVHGIVPIFDGGLNGDVGGNAPAFHIGFLPVGGTALSARMMSQANIPYFAGEGKFPTAPIAKGATEGVGAYVLPGTSDVFAFFNGNNSAWSCQYFHYREDGMFLGQFGWQGDPTMPKSGASWGFVGYAPQGLGLPQSPGMCSDVNTTNVASVGPNYIAINGDESYRKGIHAWQITSLGTVTTLTGSGSPGSTLALH